MARRGAVVLGQLAEPTMNRPTRAVWATALLFLLLACSSITAQVRRDARLREALDAHPFQQPLSKVWPAVGRPPASRFTQLTACGLETARTGDHLVLETMANSAATRYRVEGQDIDGKSCRITFTAMRRTG